MITITSSANGFNVDFNGYFDSGRVDVKNGYWSKQSISRIYNHGSYIEIKCLDSDWLLNVDESDDLFGVSGVEGQTPVSVDDLYNKIMAVM